MMRPIWDEIVFDLISLNQQRPVCLRNIADYMDITQGRIRRANKGVTYNSL